jgi:hypothetical protein
LTNDLNDGATVFFSVLGAAFFGMMFFSS